MNKVILNIGLEKGTGKKGKINANDVLKTIESIVFTVHHKIEKSSTEDTLIVYGVTKLNKEKFINEIKKVCEIFSQEAIAAKYNNQGLLIHLDKERWDWGEFNEDYFLS